MPERIVVASTGGWESVSTKYRLGPVAETGLWPIDVLSAQAFPTVAEVDAIAERGGPGSLLILQRVMPRSREMRRLRGAYRRIYFDFDDAIYAVPPHVGGSRLTQTAKAALRIPVRGYPRASSRRRPLARTLRQVDLCVAGNSILARFALGFAPTVVEIPTTVEPVDEPRPVQPETPTLVWIGVPGNLRFLELLRRPLSELGRDLDLRLRIVSSSTWSDSPIPVEFVRFSDRAARNALLTASAGIAPLTDDPWTRGKCALRALQYGAHGLPTVASPVGITDKIVVHDKTGYLARYPADWLRALRTLINERARVSEMGSNARERVRSQYSNRRAIKLWTDALCR